MCQDTDMLVPCVTSTSYEVGSTPGQLFASPPESALTGGWVRHPHCPPRCQTLLRLCHTPRPGAPLTASICKQAPSAASPDSNDSDHCICLVGCPSEKYEIEVTDISPRSVSCSSKACWAFFRDPCFHKERLLEFKVGQGQACALFGIATW